MKNLIYLTVILLSNSCSNTKTSTSISERDSLNLEKTLIEIKNYNFQECYRVSENATYERIGVNKNDTSCKKVNDLSTYYFTSISKLDLNFVMNDRNREKLVQKWVNKKEYNPYVNPPDFPDGSLNMIRALDFYNSKDMSVYIDSIRQSEIRNLKTK